MLKVARLHDRIPAVDDQHRLYYTRGAQEVLPIRMGEPTSQLDLPSLTPSSVASCGRLQLEFHWTASIDYCT